MKRVNPTDEFEKMLNKAAKPVEHEPIGEPVIEAKPTPPPTTKPRFKPEKELTKTIGTVRYKLTKFANRVGCFFIAQHRIYQYVEQTRTEGLLIGLNHVTNSKHPFTLSEVKGIYYVVVTSEGEYGIPFNKYPFVKPGMTVAGSMISIMKDAKLRDKVILDGGLIGEIMMIEGKVYTILAEREHRLYRSQFKLANTTNEVLLFDPDVT